MYLCSDRFKFKLVVKASTDITNAVQDPGSSLSLKNHSQFKQTMVGFIQRSPTTSRKTLPFPAAVKNECHQQSEQENLNDHDSCSVPSRPVDGPLAASCTSFISDMKRLFVQCRGKGVVVTKKCCAILKTRCILGECVKKKRKTVTH